jgi:S-adenosylmethionine synthetase
MGKIRNITVDSLACTPIEMQAVEIVERKGIGHPDTMCDSMMESISIELSKEYIKRFGAVMHHNIDKCLLVAGQAEHKFQGGKVTEPMLLVIGDRATFEVGGEHVDVEGIAINTSKSWLKNNLRFVEPDDMRFQSELKQGSAELTDIFRRKSKNKGKLELLGANDTSACVGYAPFTQTETLVLELERHLNSKQFKKEYPEMGEDIKVMGVRQGKGIQLTVAGPLVERFVKDEADYFKRKEELLEEMRIFAEEKTNLKPKLFFNTLDVKGRGINGCYLSVTGTSAEDADCGQVGRGNRVNGIIPLNRPVSAEAAAGKNPVSHIGKIYNVLTHKVARQIYNDVDGIDEVYVWLCSQIGKPIDQPKIAAAQLVMKKGASLKDVSKDVNEIIDKNLENIVKLCMDLATGKERAY